MTYIAPDEKSTLIKEFIWFQKYITFHDLESQLELEDESFVVYQDGKKLIVLDAANAARIRDKLSDANRCRAYADHVLKGRFELGEPIMSTSAHCALWYAQISKARFIAGEKVIALSSTKAQIYVSFLIGLKIDPDEFVSLLSAKIRRKITVTM